MTDDRRLIEDYLPIKAISKDLPAATRDLVAQAGGELIQVSRGSELAALAKLTANWRAVVEDAALTHLEREARRTGQKTLEFQKE